MWLENREDFQTKTPCEHAICKSHSSVATKEIARLRMAGLRPKATFEVMCCLSISGQLNHSNLNANFISFRIVKI